MFTTSKDYWENRYSSGDNSGKGSYGKLSEFKSIIINDFITNNDIKKIAEFGCGDGNQLSMFNINSYTGYDISPNIIDKCSKKKL
jgi:hypothetical protein